MLIFCCGFNEFGQVSSADNDRQRGFVPLPMVIDLKSKIRRQDVASTVATDDDTHTGLLSVGISWCRILYVTADGSLSIFGDAVSDSAVKPATAEMPQQGSLQWAVSSGGVKSVSCGWSRTCVVSRGLCYVFYDDDNDSSVMRYCVTDVRQTDESSSSSAAAADVSRASSSASAAGGGDGAGGGCDMQQVIGHDAVTSSSDDAAADYIVAVSTSDSQMLLVTARHRLLSVTETDAHSVGSVSVVTAPCHRRSDAEGHVVTDASLIGRRDKVEGVGMSLGRERSMLLRVRSVSCGSGHVLVLSLIGLVFSAGLNNHGQLGLGSLQSTASGSSTTTGSSLRLIESLAGLVMHQVSTGSWHSAALSDSGDVYVWGWNRDGQLGLTSSSTETMTDEDCDTSSEFSVVTLPHVLDLPLASSDVSVTSHDLFGGADDLCIVKLACGSRHSLAVASDGHAYSWGANDYGQLGHCDLVSRDSPTMVQFFVEHNLSVVDVFAGFWNSIFVTAPSGL